MHYINVTHETTHRAKKYIYETWASSTRPAKKHILARSAHLILAPASLIPVAVDTIIGLGAAIGTLFTFGKHVPTYRITFNHLDSARKFLVYPYVNILRTINPEAIFSGNIEAASYQTTRSTHSSSYQAKMLSWKGVGLIGGLVFAILKKSAGECYNSRYFLNRHVSSRLTYILLAVACVVTRVADGIIAVPAVGLSILTMGKFESLNNLAYRTLQFPSIINDLFYCTIKFINPWAGISNPILFYA